MPYTITAMSPEGTVRFRSKTPTEALQTALELMGFGLMEVSITDAEGQRHAPADFDRLYVEKRP
jgi:hypothetical protein